MLLFFQTFLKLSITHVQIHLSFVFKCSTKNQDKSKKMENCSRIRLQRETFHKNKVGLLPPLMKVLRQICRAIKTHRQEKFWSINTGIVMSSQV